MSGSNHEQLQDAGLLVGNHSQAHKDAVESLSDAEMEQLKHCLKKVKGNWPDDGDMEPAGFI